MKKTWRRAGASVVLLLGFAGGGPPAEAQRAETLVDWNGAWRYDATGRELGASWRQLDYLEDARWQGPAEGLLGWEPDNPDVYLLHAATRTALPVASSITNYYFRTFFEFTGTKADTTIMSSSTM